MGNPVDMGRRLRLPCGDGLSGYCWYCFPLASAAQSRASGWHGALLVNISAGFALGFTGPPTAVEQSLLRFPRVFTSPTPPEDPFEELRPLKAGLHNSAVALVPCGYECQDAMLVSEQLTASEMLERIHLRLGSTATVIHLDCREFTPLS